MSDEMKVSYHNETAGETAAHNDRSMYDYAYVKRDANLHFDCYGIGFLSDDNPGGSRSPSVDAEARFYERHFGGLLERTNEKYRSQGHPEKRMTMAQFKKAHPPKESIIQLGDKDDDIDDEYLRVAVAVYADQLRKAGCHVISWDIHNDETDGTPHAHIRWIGIDSQGRPNLTGALREHGVPKANKTWSEHEAIAYNKRARKRVKAGDPKGPQINNELTTFTDRMRDMLETLAEPYVAKHDAKLSRERIADAHHLTVTQFKSKKRREEAEQHLAERESQIEIAQNALEAERKQMRVAIQMQKNEIERERQVMKDEVDAYAKKRLEEDRKTLQNQYADRLIELENVTDSLKNNDRTRDGLTVKDVVTKTLEMLPAALLGARFKDPQARDQLAKTVDALWQKYVTPLIQYLSDSISRRIVNTPTPEAERARQLIEKNKVLIDERKSEIEPVGDALNIQFARVDVDGYDNYDSSFSL